MDDARFKTVFPFDVPRKFQRDVIDRIDKAYGMGKKHVLLSAPTGIGKSVIAMTLANHLGSAYILTSQKMLQDQYVKDFGIPMVKGRNNYICLRNSRLRCDMGSCKFGEGKSKFCTSCPYRVAKNLVYSSPVSILNYAYFMTMSEALNSPQIPRKLLVIDECHSGEQELISFSSINLSKDEFIKNKLGKSFLSFPRQEDADSDKLDWLFGNVNANVEAALATESVVLESLEAGSKDFKVQAMKCRYLEDILNRIGRFKSELSEGVEIIIDHRVKDEISFKVLFGRAFSDRYLFRFAELSLSMSATIFSKEQYCSDMGISPDDTVFIQCPSVFPKKNRMVHAISAGDLSYKKKEESKPKILESVRQILARHANERGIIHTVSYEIANYLYDNLADPRLIFPKGKNRDESLNFFLHSDNPNLVLISPSLQEGIDLKDDLSRFFMAVKTPYASIADPWVAARMKKDVNWYAFNTVKNLVQMCGRSIRSEDDFAIGYILDSGFNSFYRWNRDKFPGWWKESLVI